MITKLEAKSLILDYLIRRLEQNHFWDSKDVNSTPVILEAKQECLDLLREARVSTGEPLSLTHRLVVTPLT